MHFLVLLLIVVATTFEYLGQIGILPKLARYATEAVAALLLLYVVAMGVRTRFQNVRAAYLLIFGAILLVAVCGVILNAVAPGPVFTGLRNYLRPIPLFFVPAVFAFTDRQLRTQLKLLLAIALAQIPIAIFQRMRTMARGNETGDATFGTLQDSSFLSIFEIGGICLVVALYLRKRLSLTAFTLLFLLLVFPTTINETKATFVLLPIALVVVFQVLAAPGTKMRNFVVGFAMIAVFAAIFIPVYDYLAQEKRYVIKLTDFFTQQHKIEGYLEKDARLGITDFQQAGRIDSIVVPIRALAQDPSQLLLGLGIGNSSNSALGPQFVGQYFPMFQYFLQTSISRIVLELGLLGVALVMLLYWKIYQDSVMVAARSRELRGALAAGWAGFVVAVVAANFYKDLIVSDALSCLFWYFSGLIAAERVRLAHAVPRQAPAQSLTESSGIDRLYSKGR